MTLLLAEIERLGRVAGVRISDLKPQPMQSRAGRLLVYISAEATWERLAEFTYQIQHSGQLLLIQKAVIQQKGDDESLLSAQFEIGAHQ